MHTYRPEAYTPASIPEWIAISERQAAKDRILIPRIAKLLGPGPVLELGSAVGYLAQLLRNLGHKVIASDYGQFFVDYMREQGLDAYRVDATDIAAAGLGKFPNIFAQSITPFITDDLTVVERAYRSCFEALLPGGRVVLIQAMSDRAHLAQTMRDHERLAKKVGFSNVKLVRDQLLPSKAYALAGWLAGPLDAMFAPMLGSRFVISATKGSPH